MICSTQGCPKTAEIQWNKALSADVADQRVQAIAKTLEDSSNDRRLNLRVRIAAIQGAAEDPPKHLSTADLPAFKAQAQRQIDDLQKQHDAIPTSFDLEHHREGACVVLFACPDHQHDDLEWYARMHTPTCSGELGCGCP